MYTTYIPDPQVPGGSHHTRAQVRNANFLWVIFVCIRGPEQCSTGRKWWRVRAQSSVKTLCKVCFPHLGNSSPVHIDKSQPNRKITLFFRIPARGLRIVFVAFDKIPALGWDFYCLFLLTLCNIKSTVQVMISKGHIGITHPRL